MQRQIARAHALADIGRIMLDIGHAFTAARDDDIAHARLHHHRRIDDRLQAGATAPVQLVAGHLFRKTRKQP